jgi:hypothetical protein
MGLGFVLEVFDEKLPGVRGRFSGNRVPSHGVSGIEKQCERKLTLKAFVVQCFVYHLHLLQLEKPSIRLSPNWLYFSWLAESTREGHSRWA